MRALCVPPADLMTCFRTMMVSHLQKSRQILSRFHYPALLAEKARYLRELSRVCSCSRSARTVGLLAGNRPIAILSYAS